MKEGEQYDLDMVLMKIREKKRKRKIRSERIAILFVVWLLVFKVFGIMRVSGNSMRPGCHSGDIVFFLRILPDGVDYVIDAVGLNQLINQAMELIRYNGKICCYGISPKLGMDLNWSRAPYNWDLHFVQWPSKYEESLAHSQIMAWINAGVLDPYDFISDVIPFDQVIHAFERIENHEPNLKKMIVRFD